MSSTLQIAPSLASQQKRDLLAQLARQMASPPSASGQLSHGQAAIWFTQQLSPHSSAYHVVFSTRIRSKVDDLFMRQALQFLLDRHDILRTTYAECHGVPTSYLHPEMAVDFEVIPVDRKPWEQHQERLCFDIGQPFDLERGPMLRARLYRQSDDDSMLVLTLHHIAIDGGSIGILLQELRVVYAALRAQQPIRLPPLLVTYDHYVRQQTDMLAGPKGDRLRAYWLKQLSGEVPVLELPLDRPRRAVQVHRSASYAFQLSSQLTEALNTLAQREGVTLYMILLAALQILLHRYSGQDDIWVGSPIRRKQPSFRQLVGYCVNSVVMRGDLSDHPTFREFLSQVRRTVLDAIRHADYPFPLLVQHLQPQREISRSALFQVSLILQTQVLEPELLPCIIPAGNSPEPIDFGDLVLEPYPFLRQEGPFDLGFEMAEIGPSLCGLLQYNANLFDSSTIARMAQHFTMLLEGLVAHPDKSVKVLPLITAAERRQLLCEWTDTQRAYPADMCFHELFEAQVEYSPEAEAVVDARCGVLTYRKLNDQANQLAHHLRAQGVTSEAVIGVYMERCLETVISLLAIFKSGGAYLPLAPALPVERLDLMISNANAFAIVTKCEYADRLQAYQNRMIVLDADWEQIGQQPTSNPVNRSTPKSLAYVIYTSGSTGMPKGAMVEQRGLVNHLDAKIADLNLTQKDRLAETAPQSFDISIWQFLVALLVGGSVHIFDDDTVHNPGKLLDRVEAEGITIFEVVPSQLRLMLDDLNSREMNRPGFTNLRWLVLAGEVLPPRLCREWFGYYADVPLMNAYGPTECTDNVTHHAIYEAPPAEMVSVPIGRSVANLRLYVLDDQLQPTPIGVPGELYIGGVGVGRGYLNDPKRTAAAFMADPFATEPGARFYKTGDLARYLPNGTIEFLGRFDHQVKIRGCRIELGEIETVLAGHPQVRQGVVIVHERDHDDHILVAYLVPRGGSAVAVGELRRYLSEKMPNYMVPNAFVILDAIPLNPNGKIDRKALPAPETAHAVSTDTTIPPQTLEEKRLLSIWCQVLGLKLIGVHDNFFELGGHSLQAMQLVSQVSTQLQRDMPVQALFLHPTVSNLAQVLDTFPPTSSRTCHRKGGALAGQPPMQPSSPFTTFVRSAICSRLATGDLPPVHAAALAYLPASLVNLTGTSRDLILRDWCHDRPFVASLLETTWGRIALIVLPCWSDGLYRDPRHLVAMTLDGLELAGNIGARAVSLTGLLPSATDYGRALTPALAGRSDLPKVSTGHATTISAIVFTISKLLHEGERHLEQERVGFLGLGSIGRASLHLMLNVLPHPEEILLCDVYAKRQALELLAQTLRDNIGFQGHIRIVTAEPTVPAAFYDSTLIVGATNVPDILDVTRLQPGTLLVDDSAPHCFNPEQAMKRFERHRDLLFTEGGIMRSPQPFHELRYVPQVIEQTLTVHQFDTLFARHDPYEIMGCTLSSLLSSHFAQLHPTVGFVDAQSSQQSYEMLKRLGFEPAKLRCEGYALAADACRDFRQQFRSTQPQKQWDQVVSFSVEPNEAELIALEKTSDIIGQCSKSQSAQLTTGLAQW